MEFKSYPHLLEVYKQAETNLAKAPDNNEDLAVSGLVMADPDPHKAERARAEKHHAQALREMGQGEKTAYLSNTNSEARDRSQANMVRMLVHLLALYLLYYELHWKYRTFYGDHLLFQRLYGTVQGEIDSLAEKIIGYHGADSFNFGKLVELAGQKMGSWDGDPLTRALVGERGMKALFTEMYEELKKLDVMPMGLDDFVMAVCNTHDTHEYLLQQTQSGRGILGAYGAALSRGRTQG